MFVPDLLAKGVRESPGQPCVTLNGRTLTFEETDLRAARLARALHDAGILPGDRVMLIAKNELEFLEIQVACQRVGAALVAVNFRLTPTEVSAIATDCMPALLITGPEYAGVADAVNSRVHWHLGDDGSYEQALQKSRALEPGFLDGAQIAQIAYTSGTTGLPKGAQISNATLFGRIASLTTSLDITDDDVFLQTLPLFHLASLVSFAYTISGCHVTVIRDFDPADTLAVMSTQEVTRAIMVPTIIAALIEARTSGFDGDLSSMRTIFYGASPITPELMNRALNVFDCDFAQFYGMTEAGIATLLRPADHRSADGARLRSSGYPLAFYEVDVVRFDGAPAIPGEVGEIVISGPGLMDGYLGNPEATARALVNGRMYTGDAGFIDGSGYLFISDRVKDMIISGGENIFCREVETVLLAHPDVHDAAVIGLPDDKWGQTVHALIVGADSVSDDVLEDWCRDRIAAYKRPRSYEYVESLPRNAVGKILKHVLRRERQVGSLG